LLTGINSVGSSVGSMYDRLQIAPYTQVFNVAPLYGISYLRDIITTSGSATITNTGGGFTLTTTTLANDAVTIDTAERGRFSIGNSFEAGIVLQIPNPPSTNTQKATWGIFDNNNGMYFGQDSTGIFVAALRNGSETKIYQSNWNANKLDGSDLYSYTLNTNVGCMYQIRFGYNYGTIEYRVVIIDPVTSEQIPVTCHRQSTTTGTLVGDPNQPVRAHIENGTTAPAQSFVMNLRGRYYASLGNPNPTKRLTSERRLNLSTSTTFLPTVSFQRLATFPTGSGKNNSLNVLIDSFDIITDSDIIWQIRLNSTLIGASFGAPIYTLSTETCVQSDVSATAINVSTGILLMEGLATGGNHSTVLTALTSVPVDIVMPSTQIITLCIRTFSSTGIVDAVLRVCENW
jgi:hypothetical protein